MFSELKKDAENIPQTIEYKLNKGIAKLKDQEEVLELNDPFCAYYFTRFVKGADIERCQEVACKDSYSAYLFAKDIPGADIEKCQEAACKDPFWAYYFAKFIPGAQVEYCREACKGTEYVF